MGGHGLQNVMTGKQAPGQCDKCHMGIPSGQKDDVKPGSAVTFNGWKAITGYQLPIQFNHQAHYNTEAGCKGCHPIEPPGHVSETQPGIPNRGILPMKRATCSGCHNDTLVDGSCQVCHSYHR